MEDLEFGCFYCWDTRKKAEKELYFLDKANNLKLCDYCPKCGRKYGEEPKDEQLDNE